MSDRKTLQAIEAATTAEELAEALQVWAIECSEQVGESPQFWVTELWRLVEGRADETGGMTIEELIPEAIAEWNEVRDP